MALSPIFEFADRFVAEQSALDPCLATARGIPGYDDMLTDFSPEGHESRAKHTRLALTELSQLTPTDDNDRLAKDFITERFETTLLSHDAGEWQRTVRAIASPSTTLRSTFDLMSREGEEAWSNIAARLHAIPAALAGLRQTYEDGRRNGRVASRRQAIVAADQCATWATNRWFDSLSTRPKRDGVSATLQQHVRDGADLANSAYDDFASYLRDDYAPDADEADGCGPERYDLGVRTMLGAALDPNEMYEWAWNDFHHLRDEIAATCAHILPGAGFGEVIELLETDPDACRAQRDGLPGLAAGAHRRGTCSAARSTSRFRP